MHKRKSKPFDQPRLNAVIAARRDVTSRSLHHFAQCFSFFGCCRFHTTFPFSLLCILTQWWQGRCIRLVYSPRRTRGHEGIRIFLIINFVLLSLKVFTSCALS